MGKRAAVAAIALRALSTACPIVRRDRSGAPALVPVDRVGTLHLCLQHLQEGLLVLSLAGGGTGTGRYSFQRFSGRFQLRCPTGKLARPSALLIGRSHGHFPN